MCSCVYVCVCVCVRVRERESMCVCEREGGRTRKGKREREREGERERPSPGRPTADPLPNLHKAHLNRVVSRQFVWRKCLAHTRAALHCNTLHKFAHGTPKSRRFASVSVNDIFHKHTHTATHCNTLQCTAQICARHTINRVASRQFHVNESCHTRE